MIYDVVQRYYDLQACQLNVAVRPRRKAAERLSEFPSIRVRQLSVKTACNTAAPQCSYEVLREGWLNAQKVGGRSEALHG